MRKIKWQFSPLVLAFAIFVNSAFAGETNSLSRADELIVEGALHFNEGDFDEAIASFSMVIQFEPTNANAIFNRAAVYHAKGEFEKSIADYDKYILLNPTNDLAFKSRASDYAGLGQTDKAISDWNDGLRLNPNDATALAMRGFQYSRNGQFNDAQKDYYKAIQLNPTNASAWNNLGWLRATCPFASMRNGKEAVEAATKACVFSNWKNGQRIDTLAAAFAEAGDFQQAIKYQRQALGLNGANEKERKEMESRLELYEEQKPFHETSPN